MRHLPLAALAFSLLAAAPAAPWLARPHTSVTPDGTWTSVSSGSSGNNVTFTVTNNSASWESYSLSCDKSGLVSSCSPGTSSVEVGPNSSEDVSVSFAVGTGPGTGQVSLTAVSDYFEPCDPECPPDEDTGYYNVSVSSPPTPPSAVISFTAYPAQRLDYGTCLAACFTAMHAQSTVPYFSLDQARSVTLVYNEDRTSLTPFILVDVQHSPINPDTVKLQVKVNGTYVTFLGANEQTLRFTGGSGSQYHRIGGQIDASSYSTGRHAVDVIVTSVYNTQQGGYDAGTVTSTSSTDLIVLSERASPIGRGWSIAGWQRLYAQASGSALIAEGDGSYTYFAYSGGAYTSPAGDFSRLEPWGSWYRRWYPDSTRAHFNSSGQLVYLISRFSDTTKFAYDYLNRPYKITDPAGKETILAYGSYGLSAIRDPFNRYTYVTVTADTVLTAMQDPDSVSTTFGYDGTKRLQTITDRRGKTTTLTYDTQSGTLASIQAPEVYVYPVGNRNPTAWLEPWQKDGVPYSSTASTPLAPVIWDSIDAFIRAPDSVRIRFRRFNAHGQANFVHQPLGVVDTAYYNANGQVTDARTAFGLRSTFTYDATGFLTQSVVDGDTVNFRNGGWGQADLIWGDVPTQQRYLQGGTGLLDSVRVAGASEVQAFTYGAHGRLFTAHDQEEHLTLRRWYTGANGNLSKDSLPGGRVTTYAYDTYGRDTSVSQTGLPTRRVTYDVLNRPTAVYDGVYGTPTQFAYDSLYLKSVTDAKGQVYQYVRDALGRVTGQIDAVGRRDTTQYGWMGEVKRYVNRRDQAVTMTYDSLNRRTVRQGTNLTADTLVYTPNGRVVTGRAEATIEAVYLNRRGQPDSVQTLFRSDTTKKFWRRYGYDYRGRVSSVATTGSDLTFTTRGYAWNANGTLGSLTLGSTTTSLGYNADLRRDLTTLPGTSHTLSQQLTSLHQPSWLASVALNDRYHYDLANRLDGANHSLDKQEWYTYDGLSRLDSVAFWSGVNFCYEFVEWLGYLCIFGTQDSAHTFVYDSVGNRTDSSGSYTTGNRITYFDGCSYGTDDDGNVTSRTCSGDTGSFMWNALNQLTSYTRNGATVYLRYDAFGQLVLEYGSGVTDQGFLWDRGHVFAAVNSGLTSVIAQYSYYPGLDRPHALVVGSTQYYAHQDALGNTKALTTSDKTVQRTYVYDEWGQLKGGSDNAGLSGKDRARFKGAFWMGDGGVELYYMRSRWYEPNTGRFLSEDPIGLAGGINPYAFAAGDPVNSRDPVGLHSCNAAGGDHIHQVEHSHRDAETGEKVTDSVTIVIAGGCGDETALTDLAARHGAVLLGMGIPVSFDTDQSPFVSFATGFADAMSLGIGLGLRFLAAHVRGPSWNDVAYGSRAYWGGVAGGAASWAIAGATVATLYAAQDAAVFTGAWNTGRFRIGWGRFAGAWWFRAAWGSAKSSLNHLRFWRR